MRVVIAGGGSVGKFIAESLHKGGHEVLIVDNDAAVVRRAVAANEPPGVAVEGCGKLHGSVARRA